MISKKDIVGLYNVLKSFIERNEKYDKHFLNALYVNLKIISNEIDIIFKYEKDVMKKFFEYNDKINDLKKECKTEEEFNKKQQDLENIYKDDISEEITIYEKYLNQDSKLEVKDLYKIKFEMIPDYITSIEYIYLSYILEG